MSKLSKLAMAALVGAFISVSVSATEKPFVTVNGAAVSTATADMFMAQGKSRGMPDTPEIKAQLREELIGRELMWQEAKKTGFDKKPDIAAKAKAEEKKILAQAEATKQAVIVRAFVEDYLKKNPVTDAQLKAEYDAQNAKGGPTEFKIRHILVKTNDEAMAIIASLGKGAKFEDLAKQSLDTGSNAAGGLIDWSSPAKFVKPFADAIVALKKGTYTQVPVKSNFGFHVIKMEDTRPRKAPTFEEMKPMLQQAAQSQTVEKLIGQLRAKAKIE